MCAFSPSAAATSPSTTPAPATTPWAVVRVAGSNGNYTPAADGKFFYAGSHMQTHAARHMALGSLNNAGLADASAGHARHDVLRRQLPLLAAAARGWHQHLGQCVHRVSAQIAAPGSGRRQPAQRPCPLHQSADLRQRHRNAVPTTESPNYSIGHWVEDTLVADGAYQARAPLVSTRGSSRPRPTTACWCARCWSANRRWTRSPAVASCGWPGPQGGILTATQPRWSLANQMRPRSRRRPTPAHTCSHLIEPADGDGGVYGGAAGHVTMVRDVVLTRCAGVVVEPVERF